MREIKFRGRNESKWIFPTPLGQEIYTLEVIGNVYENKELLESSKTIS